MNLEEVKKQQNIFKSNLSERERFKSGEQKIAKYQKKGLNQESKK